MNALVKLGMNVAQLASPTLAERQDAARQVTSLATANVLGRLGYTEALTKAGDPSASSKAASISDASINQDMFLELLVTQMQNQDPLEPMENSDMLAQLAQFSSLEQMNNLNDSFEVMSGNIDQLNFISASAMLGREVVGVDDQGDTIEGVVDGVFMEGSIVYLTVDGATLSMAGLLAVR